jgi:hypothetical protein
MTMIIMMMMIIIINDNDDGMVIIIMVVTMIIITLMKHWCNDKQQKETYLTPNLAAKNQYGRFGLENCVSTVSKPEHICGNYFENVRL